MKDLSKEYEIHIDPDTSLGWRRYYWEIVRIIGKYGRKLETSGYSNSVEEAVSDSKKSYQEVIKKRLETVESKA